MFLGDGAAAEKLRTAYYAGEAFIHLDRGGDEGDVDRLRQAGADFLVVDETQIAKRPDLAERRDRLVELFRVDASGRTGFVYDLREVGQPGS